MLSPTKSRLVLLGLVICACLLYSCLSPQSQTPTAARPQPSPAIGGDYVTIMSWNVRGYPEKSPEVNTWLHDQIMKSGAQIICIQEIANQKKVDLFCQSSEFTQSAFLDSPDGQDNAIFAVNSIEMQDLPDPDGFQHPVQVAYLASGGFDAVIVTVHLSWTDKKKREAEKIALKKVVENELKIDPDVMVVGDFNTEGKAIEDLAKSLGLYVMNNPGASTHAGHRYDYFLVSTDLQSEEAKDCQIVFFATEDEALAKKASDHLPVVAKFKTDQCFRDRAY